MPNTSIGTLSGLRILGTSLALPRDIEPSCAPLDTTRAALKLGLTTEDAARAARYGVSARSLAASPGERPVVSGRQLAALAALRALDEARLPRADLMLVATATPDRISASLASRVAHDIGHEGLALDTRAGGVGALAALATASALLRSGPRSALVVGVEVISPYLAPGDLGSLLYGDGAAAVVIGEGAPEGGLIGARFGTEVLEGRAFSVPGPLPPEPSGDYTLRTPDRTYRDALRALRWRAARELLSMGAPDHLLAYGATQEAIDEISEITSVPARSTLRETGCLGNAALLAALHAHGGELAGSVGMTAAAGGGSWGALLWRL